MQQNLDKFVSVFEILLDNGQHEELQIISLRPATSLPANNGSRLALRAHVEAAKKYCEKFGYRVKFQSFNALTETQKPSFLN